jgi:hypothetical protein
MKFHLAALITLSLLAASVQARFVSPDLERVPVERLVKNLQEVVDKEPKNVQARYNLARVHAMAYALKNDTCEINKRGTNPAPWFGNTPAVVPFKSVETKDKDQLEQAKKHLQKAISTYGDVLKLQADYLPAQLGLAWCVEQSGDKVEAIKAYRKVIEAGWETEGKLTRGPLGGNYITKEAAGYLIPLLDTEKDGKEIDTLNVRVAQLNKLPRPVTPIAVPLKDGLTWRDLEDRNAAVGFDVDGTGLGKRWSWITKDAGWLVYDPHKTGKITSGLQLFGNVTFWCFFDNGYEALRCLDDNADGVLTGSELDGIAIWHDANGDGICQPEEIRPLSYYGVAGMSCAWQTDTSHPDRIAFSPAGVVLRDGSTRPTFDLILKQR